MKFCLFMAMSISLIFYGIMAPSREFRLENFFVGEFAFYTTDNVESPLITRSTDWGFSFIHHTHSRNATNLRPMFSRIDGESVTIREQLDAQEILSTLNARKISQSVLTTPSGKLKVVHAFSSRIPNFITQGGRRINIQIAIRPTSTVIGTPLILGSF